MEVDEKTRLFSPINIYIKKYKNYIYFLIYKNNVCTGQVIKGTFQVNCPILGNLRMFDDLLNFS